jgi:hypothetical protein
LAAILVENPRQAGGTCIALPPTIRAIATLLCATLSAAYGEPVPAPPAATFAEPGRHIWFAGLI